MNDVQALELGFDIPKPPSKVARFLEFKNRFDALTNRYGPVYPSSMVAKALQLSRTRICALVASGDLVQVKIDTHAFVTEASIRNWIALNRKGGRPLKALTLGESVQAARELFSEYSSGQH